MSSSAHGIHSSGVEVTNVSAHGLWLLSEGKGHFLSFRDFPWFEAAPIGQVTTVQELSPGHFYWPDLDIDLGIDTIENPDRYPLTALSKGE